MDAFRPTAAETDPASTGGDATLPLATAVRELFSGLRAGAADVADLVAAEAHVAVRLLVAMVLAAVGAAILGVFGLAGLAGAGAAELIARGLSVSMAVAIVAVVCLLGSVALLLQLRALSRRVLFAKSRTQLRGTY